MNFKECLNEDLYGAFRGNWKGINKNPLEN